MSHQMLEYARYYHSQLSDRVRTYLLNRGLTPRVIDEFLLGWSGWRITIPIYDANREVSFFKLAKGPDDQSDGPKMLTTPGARAELYGWEHLGDPKERVIICEGEFDRLLLESRGYAAVTSTAGAATFRKEWAMAFESIPHVFVCFDRDVAGYAGAARVAQMIPQARVVTLPPEVGEAGDVTDFFVKLKRSNAEFDALLAAAERPIERPTQIAPLPPERGATRDVDALKAGVRIEAVVGRHVELSPKGESFVGLCPFHDDRRPSLVVFPSSQTFYCFACRAHGDVVAFLIQIGHLTFPEALEALRRFAA